MGHDFTTVPVNIGKLTIESLSFIQHIPRLERMDARIISSLGALEQRITQLNGLINDQTVEIFRLKGVIIAIDELTIIEYATYFLTR
jgi:hypothetical protein